MTRFLFDTGVKPFEFTPPAAMATMKGFVNSGNGVYVIPFYCEDVPKQAVLKHCCDQFIPDTDEMICREIHNSILISKYAHFIIPKSNIQL